MICEYGCGQIANVQLKNGKSCCSTSPNKCPSVRMKNSESLMNRKAWNKGIPAWNKGKNKETDSRVLKLSVVLKRMYKSGEIKGSWTGKHHSQDTRKKLSLYRKNFLSKHPELHPNRLVAGNILKMTYPEQLVYEYLKNNNYSFKHNARIDKFWVDFLINSNIVIEVDGIRWHTSNHQIDYDKKRDDIIRSLGFIIFRISSSNVIHNLINVLRDNNIRSLYLDDSHILN